MWAAVGDCWRGSRGEYDSMKPVVTPSDGHMNSVSQIDTMSRVMFPFAFVCLNILYWSGFLYYF